MAERNLGESARNRKADPMLTQDVDRWRLSIADRDRVYAVSYRQAVDNGKSPEEARALARDSFLRSFEESPEVQLIVSLESRPFHD